MASLEKTMRKMNPEQLQAVVSENDRVLVIAGAGSGKTSVLTTRIAYWQKIRRVGTSSMLALTFTRLAALEMKERVAKLLGESMAKKLTAGTFHSFCVKVLHSHGQKVGLQRGFSVYDQDDTKAILEKIIADLRLQSIKASSFNPWEPGNSREQQMASQEYKFRLRRSNAVDLDGLLCKTIELLEKHPDVAESLRNRFQQVYLDEYQDTDDRQERILQLINPMKLFIVGDPSQAIYSWRGARIENILTFEERNPECEVIRLERNYRSTQPILDMANRVIEQAAIKSPLKLWTDKEGPSPVRNEAQDETDELGRIAQAVKNLIGQGESPENIAVLCRTNGMVSLANEELRRAGLETFVFSPKDDPLNDFTARRLMDFMALAINDKDERAFLRVLNWPTERISPGDMARIEKEALLQGEDPKRVLMSKSGLVQMVQKAVEQDRECWTDALAMFKFMAAFTGIRQQFTEADLSNRLADLEDAERKIASWVRRQNEMGEGVDVQSFLRWIRTRDIQDRLVQETPEAVQILTVHGAKGLEWPVVFVPGCNAKVFPTSKGDIEEERRLFYVAVTRAKESLTVLWARTRADWSGNPKAALKSPFLD